MLLLSSIILSVSDFILRESSIKSLSRQFLQWNFKWTFCSCMHRISEDDDYRTISTIIISARIRSKVRVIGERVILYSIWFNTLCINHIYRTKNVTCFFPFSGDIMKTVSEFSNLCTYCWQNLLSFMNFEKLNYF